MDDDARDFLVAFSFFVSLFAVLLSVFCFIYSLEENKHPIQMHLDSKEEIPAR